MAWFNHSRQDVLPLDRENYGVSEDPALVILFKGRLTSDPTLDTAAKLLTRKMEILKNPKMSAAFKKQAIKQIDPDIEL